MKLMKTVTNQQKAKVLLMVITQETKIKIYHLKEYRDMIRSYLSDMINDHKTSRRDWKIQLTMQINFISSKDSDETRTMYTESHNI